MFRRFWAKYKRSVFVAVLFLAPLVSLLLMNVPMPRLNLYEKASAWVVHPVAGLFDNAGRGMGVLWGRYVNLIDTSDENTELSKQNSLLSKQILEMQEQLKQYQRLQGMLSVQSLQDTERVVARVVGQDSSLESLSFILNVGSTDGIVGRMPVVTADGVVGTIRKVYRNSSVFVALTDPTHKMDGIVVRSRARMIIQGKGKPLTSRLRYLDRAADVRDGDMVISSGLDGVFPKGYPVGTIVYVKRPLVGVVQEAEMRPHVDLGKLEEVMVLKTLPPQEEIHQEGEGSTL